MRRDVIYLCPGFFAQSLLVLPFLCSVGITECLSARATVEATTNNLHALSLSDLRVLYG